MVVALFLSVGVVPWTVPHDLSVSMFRAWNMVSAQPIPLLLARDIN